MTRRSIILSETVNGLTPVLLLFSIFLLFRGHNAPGGGFAGGLVMGAAIILRYLASGVEGVRSLRVDPVFLIGLGLTVAVLTGLGSFVAEGDFLESAIWKFHPPLIGEVKFVTASIFDIGVFLVVVGVVMAVLVALVEADDETARQDLAARPELVPPTHDAGDQQGGGPR